VNRSDDVSQISAALTKAVAEIEDIAKTRTAEIPTKTGGKYTYSFANLADVYAAVRAKLSEHGLAVVQEAFSDDRGPLVSTLVVHESGQWLETRPLRVPAGADAQSHGSAIAYARRYQLLAVVGAATEDDDGAAAAAGTRPARQSRRRDAGSAAAAAPEEVRHMTDFPAAGPPARRAGAIAESQVRAMAIEFQKAGITDRDERLAFIAEAIGRTVDSSKDLTKNEATAVFDALHARSNG
jgi:hypothetical protein